MSNNAPESTRKAWADSLEGVISERAIESRKKGDSYLYGCTIVTRGENFLLADKASAPLMFVGFDGYLIAPLERAVLLPSQPTWLQRIAIRILGTPAWSLGGACGSRAGARRWVK